MNILAMHTGHDAALAIFEDYELKFVVKEERLDREKMSGYKYPKLCVQQAHKKFDFKKIDMVVLTKWSIDREHTTTENFFKKLERKIGKSLLNKSDKYTWLIPAMTELKKTEYEIVDSEKFKKDFGLRDDCELLFTSHHLAHALPALFYKPQWHKALIYTADGGGDTLHFGAWYFDGHAMRDIFDSNRILNYNCGDEASQEMGNEISSMGVMYSTATAILGFKYGRHEGKVTGLAAFGDPVDALKIVEKYYVSDNGHIDTYLSEGELKPFLEIIYAGSNKEDFAASVQKALEYLILESIKKLKRLYDFSCVGLSGGVFGNVKLNQRISEIKGVEDVFVFPPMSDDGLVFGLAFDALIQQYGFDSFLKNRRELGMPYFGEDFGDIKPYVDTSKFTIIEGDKEKVVSKTVELLRDKKVCAIFTKGMEYGPRALGARSILIDPSDRTINDSVNQRLSRTEFMPFAPYVRKERVRDVFEVTESNLNAMKYMTITCDVKKEWHDKIPAVVHVDGTARPQTIEREDNPLYYDILHEFEKQTGIPCLVNTSFNAHEEPIINTPEEALRALYDDRIDYLITQDCVVGKEW